ncbi:UNVERIFIED_CONTAM: hypothetical protein PYX00_002068 [Menopon gallinae]|uniref:Uncharacterized protein n=1 Tax=Menopon gallinae TaxID=328185 RepID=A0AAW2IHI9_9NEOP
MSGKIVTSNTVQEPVNENERVAPCEENNRVVLNESNSGKILIEVSLSRQNVHEYEITQIIKEIFELNNHDLEVEKVVMPIGQDTWQIRKATIDNLIESDTNLTKKQKSPQQSSMKLVNHKKMYKLAPQNLTKLKHSLRKKLNEKNLLEETLTRTVSEVHSSTAVTNLLSQLYPNPYNLINLMELADETGPTASTETLDVSSNDKAKLTTNNAPPAKEGEKEAKIIPPAEGQPTVTHRDPETAETVKKDREEIKPVADQSGTDHKSQERSTSRKVKRMKIPSEDRLITISEDVAADIIAKKHESHAEPKPRSKNSEVTAEDKGKLAHKKHTSKSGDSLKVHEKPPSKKRGGEKSVSVIHPFSIIKKTPPSEEGRDSSLKVGSVQEVSEDRLTPKKKGGESEKNKCVMQYLKLIKDLYEAEEKDLQDKIDGAWNYMLNVDAPIKRQGKSKFHHHTSKFFTGRMNDKSWKNCPLQSTMSDKKGKSIECREVVDQTRNLEVPVMTLCETVPRPVFPTRSDSLNTWIGHTPFRYTPTETEGHTERNESSSYRSSQ